MIGEQKLMFSIHRERSFFFHYTIVEFSSPTFLNKYADKKQLFERFSKTRREQAIKNFMCLMLFISASGKFTKGSVSEGMEQKLFYCSAQWTRTMFLAFKLKKLTLFPGVGFVLN